MASEIYLQYDPGPLPVLEIPAHDNYYRICDIAVPFNWEYSDEAAPVATEHELEQISRHAWFSLAWYKPYWQTQAIEDNLCMSGHNTVSFYKYGDDQWGYRKITWQTGPYTVPEKPVPLADALERLHDWDIKTWRAFCERHPISSE